MSETGNFPRELSLQYFGGNLNEGNRETGPLPRVWLALSFAMGFQYFCLKFWIWAPFFCLHNVSQRPSQWCTTSCTMSKSPAQCLYVTIFTYGRHFSAAQRPAQWYLLNDQWLGAQWLGAQRPARYLNGLNLHAPSSPSYVQ